MTAPLLLLRRAVNGGRLTPKEGVRAHAFLDGLQIRQETPGATHWPECWREHHGCAVARAERLAALLHAITDDMAAADWAHWRERVEADLGATRA